MKEGPEAKRSAETYTPKFKKGDPVHYQKAEWAGGGYGNGEIIRCSGTLKNGVVETERCKFYICENGQATSKKRDKSADELHAGWHE